MSEPHIDFTQIEFPSDRLTIKELRQKFPIVFDHPPADGSRPWRSIAQGGDNLETLLGAIINTERELAARAYYDRLGQELPASGQGAGYRDEAAECLGHDYVSYGLAHGPHEAEQLIRQIETQAQAQADRHLGRLR